MKRLFIILFTLVISQVTLAQIKVLGISAAGWSEDETTVFTITCPTDIDVTASRPTISSRNP